MGSPAQWCRLGGAARGHCWYAVFVALALSFVTLPAAFPVVGAAQPESTFKHHGFYFIFRASKDVFETPLYRYIVLYYGWTGGPEAVLALILPARSALTVG